MTEQNNSNRNLLRPGIYSGRALKGWQWNETKKGVIEMQIPFNVKVPGVNGEQPSYVRRWGRLFFSEKANAISVRALNEMGWDGDETRIHELYDNTLEVLSKNVVDLTIVHDTYDGRTVDKIDAIGSPWAPRVQTPVSLANLTAFANRMKALRVAAAAAAAAGTASNGASLTLVAPAEAEPQTDDIPF